MWKCKGDNKHLHLQPVSTVNHSISFPFIGTQHFLFLYIIDNIDYLFTNFYLSNNFTQRFSPIVSKAAPKSTKLTWTAILCSLTFSKICLTINNAWTVSLFCQNPHCVSQVNCPLCLLITYSSTWLKTFTGMAVSIRLSSLLDLVFSFLMYRLIIISDQSIGVFTSDRILLKILWNVLIIHSPHPLIDSSVMSANPRDLRIFQLFISSFVSLFIFHTWWCHQKCQLLFHPELQLHAEFSI